MASITDTPLVFIRLDVRTDSISAGILEPGVDDPIHDTIFHAGPSVRRLSGRFEPATIRVVYEAGPTGDGLARLLASMGIDCRPTSGGPPAGRSRGWSGLRPDRDAEHAAARGCAFGARSM
jgi:hypothetical protein